MAPSACPGCGGALLPLDDAGAWACPRCCEDQLLQECRLSRFNVAVIEGGIELVDARGTHVLAAGEPAWRFPLFVATVLLAVLGVILVVVFFVDRASVGFVAVLAVALPPLSFAAGLVERLRRRRTLRLDRMGRRCMLLDHRGREVLAAPLGAIRKIGVRVVADPSYGDHFEPLLWFDAARLRLEQHGAAEAASAMAVQLARRAGLPHEPRIAREIPYGSG